MTRTKKPKNDRDICVWDVTPSPSSEFDEFTTDDEGLELAVIGSAQRQLGMARRSAGEIVIMVTLQSRIMRQSDYDAIEEATDLG